MQTLDSKLKHIHNDLLNKQLSLCEQITDTRYKNGATGKGVYDLVSEQHQLVMKIRILEDFVGVFGEELKKINFVCGT